MSSKNYNFKFTHLTETKPVKQDYCVNITKSKIGSIRVNITSKKIRLHQVVITDLNVLTIDKIISNNFKQYLFKSHLDTISNFLKTKSYTL